MASKRTILYDSPEGKTLHTRRMRGGQILVKKKDNSQFFIVYLPCARHTSKYFILLIYGISKIIPILQMSKPRYQQIGSWPETLLGDDRFQPRFYGLRFQFVSSSLISCMPLTMISEV